MFDWSASRINSMNYCRRRYFLHYILKEKELNLGEYIRGRLVHSLVEKFWEKIGTSEEIKRNKDGKITSKKKYSNDSEFVQHSQRQWIYMMKKEEMSGREVVWNFDNEMWHVRNSYLPEVCGPLFHKLIEEGKPIASEINFDFILGNRRFNGFIDELRLRDRFIVIRDYKTEKPYLKEGSMKLAGNPQLTLYCVGLESLCLKDDELAEKLGMTEEREIFRKNPLYISPKIKPELFMVSALSKKFQESENPPKIIQTTERSERDFRELLVFVEDSEREIRHYADNREIPPTERSRKCDYCDVRVSCVKRVDEKLSSEPELKDKNGQTHFSFLGSYSHKHRAGTFCKVRRFKWKK